MSDKKQRDLRSQTLAHVLPFVVFMAFLPLSNFFRYQHSLSPWYRQAPEHWIYPLQCLFCLVLLIYFWKNYNFGKLKKIPLAIFLAAIGILVWILPNFFYHNFELHENWSAQLLKISGVISRADGFNPEIFPAESTSFFITISLRIFRACVIVPIVEELFWRSFLMRYLIDANNFSRVAFGTYNAKSFWLSSIFFMLAHSPYDWPAALIYGALSALLAVRSKSLSSCILMHVLANALLCGYILYTKEWGFW